MLSIAAINYSYIMTLLAAGMAMGFGAIGCGVGVGMAGGCAVVSSARQPKHAASTLKHMLIGQAVTETPGIFALVIGLLLLFMPPDHNGFGVGLAMIAAAIAVGVSAIGTGTGNGRIAGAANNAIARQPEHAGPITVSMLIAQALCETPAIFGLLVAFICFIGTGLFPDLELAGSTENVVKSTLAGVKLLSAGICMGFGAIGPALGISIVGGTVCENAGKYIERRGLLHRTMFVGAAITESCSIFAFVVAILLLFVV